MDFVRYAERSAGLVNADLADADARDRRSSTSVRGCTTQVDGPRRRRAAPLPARAPPGLRGVQRRRRGRGGRAAQRAARQAPGDALHRRSRRQGRPGPNWHMHVADRQSSVAELLVAESLMGLSTLVCDLGATRLGVCDASPCTTSSSTPPPTSRGATAPTGARPAPTWPPTAPRQKAAAAEHETDGPADRPVRQDPAARDRPRARPGLPQGDRAVRRARALPRARPHLPAHPARPLERPRRRPRRRAGRRHAAELQPVRRPARPARRHRRDDGPLRPAPARQAPHPRPGAHQHRPAGARGGAARQEGQADARHAARRRRRWPSTPPSAATSSRRCSSSAGRPRTSPGYVDGEAHPIDARRGRLDAAALPARGRRVVLARRVRRRRAALRRRQDASSARPRWRRPRPPR